ncbi:MAG TPA: response regulator transcription factor [Acidimicrobiia bacterium]|nr:response regulator transcription factor [Acidimicrobiia bacterium]
MEIALVDDHNMTREGLCALIERQPDLVVVGQAASVRGAVALSITPSAIVTEVDLPDAKHGDVITRLRERFSQTPILVLTSDSHPSKVQSVLAAGANGYLLKTASSTDLLAGIRAVAAGESYLQPALGVELARWHRPRDTTSGLSQTEQQILRWIALGHTNPEIARLCHVSLRTVEAHRARIQQKLGRRTRAELVEYVREMGLVDFDSSP